MRKYPATRVSEATETKFGRKLTDSYRWLEDGESPEVVKWSAAQNEATRRTLEAHADLPALQEELSQLFDNNARGLPFFRAGYYYWHERLAGQNQAAFYRCQTLDGTPELLIDPNGRREDDAIALTMAAVSPQGTYLVYGMSESGTEMSVIRLRNLETGEELEADSIPYSRNPGVSWLGDESGFFYTRNPEPGTVEKVDEQYYELVCRHALGRSWRNDEVIFGSGRHKEDRYDMSMSSDRKILIIQASRNWTESSIYLYKIDAGTLNTLVEGDNAQYSLSIVGEQAFLWTNAEAEFGKVLFSPLAEILEPVGEWAEFIAERSYSLEGINFTADFAVVNYLRDACSYVEVLDYDGQTVDELALPDYSTFEGISCDYERTEFFFSVTSFLVPSVDYSCDTDLDPVEFYRLPSVIDPEDYQVRQEWYESRDGTKVPMFMVSLKSAVQNGDNPTLLYGYGGFQISITPSFMKGFVPFLKRGGMLAIANIRGGGEFGEAWHRDGMLEKKQNSFDDFIAAGRYLISQKWTSSKRLAIYGGSNGGLLVGACAVQEPELFRAVICAVPLLDMVRFPHFLIASRWMSEYGNPDVEDDFNRIIQWSPYHNFDPARPHPAMLLETADHDTRVDPLHARKMGALMQAAGGTAPVLIRTETQAGHGSGTPVSKMIQGRADMLAFVFWQLGVSI